MLTPAQRPPPARTGVAGRADVSRRDGGGMLTRSLAVLRYRGGKKVPPQLQRFRSDDLLAAVFPPSAGCLENHSGDIEIPDHPLVRQTVDDCLHEAMDIDRLDRTVGGTCNRAWSNWWLATRASLRPSAMNCSTPILTRFWTTPRWKNAARGPWPRAARCRSIRCEIWPGSTRRLLPWCGLKPGRPSATRTRCTTCCNRCAWCGPTKHSAGSPTSSAW